MSSYSSPSEGASQRYDRTYEQDQRPWWTSDFRALDKLEALHLNFSGNPIRTFTNWGGSSFRDMHPSHRAFFHFLGIVCPDVKHFSLDVSYSDTSACMELGRCLAPVFHVVRFERDFSFTLETLAIFMAGTAFPVTWRTVWDNYPISGGGYPQKDVYRMDNPEADNALIPRFPQLRQLTTSLASWKLGDVKVRDFLISLGEEFPQLDSLVLDLAWNMITNQGLQDIGGGLQRLKGLTSVALNLQGSAFSKETVSGLITVKPEGVDKFVVELDSLTFKYSPDETTTATTPSSTAITSSPPPATHVATLRSTNVVSSVDGDNIKSVVHFSTVSPARSTAAETAEGINTARGDSLATSVRATTTSPQQNTHHQPQRKETYFGQQLALGCVCGIIVGAGYVWWMKKSDDKPDLELRLTANRHESSS
mmetsp:Transcript_73334/g.174709  ORF Transcript_73334/g.174709 Transcript_73334/m.174709 type:complete len:422 (+) Transcript_73334:427-1692(+)